MSKKVLFFGPYPPPITGQSIAFKEVYDNYEYDKILCNTTHFKDNKVLNTIYSIFDVTRIFLFKRFDTVYFTCTRSKLGFFKDLYLILWCSVFQKRIVNHLHGADFITFYEQSGSLKRIIHWAYNKIDVSIVLLSSMQEQFKYFPKMKLTVVKNSFPSEYKNVSVDIESKKNQVLYLSNLIESKGILVFMEAMDTILKNNSNVSALIAGKPMGDEYSSENEIYEKFNNLYSSLKEKYQDRISYSGGITGKAKEKALSESSIFVLPTFYKTEAFPLTIIEAMRFGNAIITTKHNYLPEVVGQQNGLLVIPKSVDSLTQNIQALIDDSNRLKKIQEYNIQDALENYNSDSYLNQVKNIIISN